MKNFLVILLITSIVTVFAQEKKHTVAKGETLFSISKKHKISVDEIKEWNKLTSNDLSLGQDLIISKINNSEQLTHKVASGETLYGIAKKHDVSVAQIKEWNKLQSESLNLGQTLTIKPSKAVVKTETVHSVTSGETLYSISQDYSMSVKDLIKINKLESNALSIGQQLIVTEAKINPEEKTIVETTNKEIKEATKRDIIHTVNAKETLFSISRIYGVHVSEIKKLNKLPTYEISIGQKLIIQDKKSSETEVQGVEPSFLSKETGNASLNFNSSISHKKYSYCLHKTLKVGTIVKVTNTDSNDFIYARVMGLLSKSDSQLIGINQVIADKIGNGLSTFPSTIEYAK